MTMYKELENCEKDFIKNLKDEKELLEKLKFHPIRNSIKDLKKLINDRLNKINLSLFSNQIQTKEKKFYYYLVITDTNKKELAYEQIRKDLDEEAEDLSSVYWVCYCSVNEKFRASKAYEKLINSNFYKITLLKMELDSNLEINVSKKEKISKI